MHDFTLEQSDIAEAQARSLCNRRAEDAARARRLDKDRIIAAGLDALCARANSEDSEAFIVGYAGLTSTRDAYCLIDEIRATLSPLVR